MPHFSNTNPRLSKAELPTLARRYINDSLGQKKFQVSSRFKFAYNLDYRLYAPEFSTRIPISLLPSSFIRAFILFISIIL